MKKLIRRFRNWYEHLSLRERALCMLLLLALIYASFSLILMRPVNNQRAAYLEKIKDAKSQISSLEIQIGAVDKIASSPLYLEWKEKHVVFEKLQTRYKTLISKFSSHDWHEIIKRIVAAHPNVTLAHIENSPEKPFAPEITPDSHPNIFQQNLTLVLYGDYFNIINYLQSMEKELPNIHWDTLKYEVVLYPKARVTIGLSVFYGKNTNS